MKGHNSKSYGPLVTILPLHLSYLTDRGWYKFHRSRTINIKVIEQNAFYFFENLPRDITPRVIDSWPILRYTQHIQPLFMFIQTFNFLAFIIPEKSVTKIFKNVKIENLSRNITPRVMGPWPPFCQSINIILILSQNWRLTICPSHKVF